MGLYQSNRVEGGWYALLGICEGVGSVGGGDIVVSASIYTQFNS